MALLTLWFLCLAGCATDDEPFPVHSGADSEVPVAGAASPAREIPALVGSGSELELACSVA